MDYKYDNDDFNCISPCYCINGTLFNNNVDSNIIERKMKQRPILSSKIDCKTNSISHFWNADDIDKLDLDIILADNVLRAIYNRGVHDGSKICHINKIESKETLPSEIDATMNTQTNKLSIKKEIQNNHLELPSITKLVNTNNSQNNTFKSSLNVFNVFEPQFEMSENTETSYVPLPAMHLMISSELEHIDQQNNLCKESGKNMYSSKKYNSTYVESQNDKLHTTMSSIINTTKNYRVRKKKNLKSKDSKRKNNNNHQPKTPIVTNPTNTHISKKYDHKHKCLKADKVVLPDLAPLIPLSVTHYMNELKSD